MDQVPLLCLVEFHERWSEPGCGYTLESSRPHSPPVRPATVLGKHKVVCLFGPRTTIIHAFFVHSSLNVAQCVSVRVDTPLDGAQCWHARSSTERTHLLQHRSRHTPPRASYSQGARAGAMAPHPTPSQHGGSCERQPPARRSKQYVATLARSRAERASGPIPNATLASVLPVCRV